MFDITQLVPTSTSFLHLKSPIDEEPLFSGSGEDKKPVGITFHAPGSEVYEAADKRNTNRSLARGRKKVDLNADLLRADRIDFLAAITISFDNLSYPPAGAATGEALFKAFYGDPKFGWAFAQANSHLQDWANFLEKLPTS